MNIAPSSDSALIQAVEQANSAEALQAASAALASHLAAQPSPAPRAVTALVQVLGFNNPGAAVAAVDGLIACGEAAVEPLLANLDAHNYGARAWAVRALAGIGDVRGLELLEQALSGDIGPSVRRAAARGLGQLRCGALETQERQRIQRRALGALSKAASDGEWVVRYAVVVGLESLAQRLLENSSEASPEDGNDALQQIKAVLNQLQLDPSEATPVVQLRARQALLQLQGRQGAPPTRVLFVCLGNICRSPAAEGVFLHLLQRAGLDQAFEVDSAGTAGWHQGKPADRRMLAAAQRRGIELPSRARQLEHQDLQHFDHVLTMDADNLAAVEALLGSSPGQASIRPLTRHCRRLLAQEVPDPYYGGPEGFDQVLDLLEDACEGLLENLLLERGHPHPPSATA
jgi:protein-tyrosine-phosphatase